MPERLKSPRHPLRAPSSSAVPQPDRLRRPLSPSFGARANAAASIEELAEAPDGVRLHGSDVALLSGLPAGLSQRRVAGRLGTALWEVFPGHVALLDRDGVLVSVNEAWRHYAL